MRFLVQGMLAVLLAAVGFGSALPPPIPPLEPPTSAVLCQQWTLVAAEAALAECIQELPSVRLQLGEPRCHPVAGQTVAVGDIAIASADTVAPPGFDRLHFVFDMYGPGIIAQDYLRVRLDREPPMDDFELRINPQPVGFFGNCRHSIEQRITTPLGAGPGRLSFAVHQDGDTNLMDVNIYQILWVQNF
jgi:hypothetical protein